MNAVREILNMEEDPSLLVQELRGLLEIDIPTPQPNLGVQGVTNPHAFHQPPQEQQETAHFGGQQQNVDNTELKQEDEFDDDEYDVNDEEVYIDHDEDEFDPND